MKINHKIIIPILVFLPLILFLGSFKTYFSQDDFFHLRVVMTKNFQDIPSFFFSLQKEYAFYRPLSRETFNLLMFKTFHLNPLPFHIFNYCLIIFNTTLCFLVIKKLFNDKSLGLFSAMLYILSATHSVELYYLASVQTLFVTTFLLLSIYFYISFLKSKFPANYFFSILFYILALLSHETAVVLSSILFLITLFIHKQKFNSIKIFYYLIPFLLLTIFYLFNTSLFNNLPGEKVYRPIFSIKSILNTLSWYILWSFGLSEIIVDFIGPRFKVNPNLLKWYSDYLQITISSFVVLVLSIIFFISFYREKLIKNIYLLLIAIFSYIISLSPFLFFPQHKFTYYMSFSTIWFSLFIGIILNIVWQYQKLAKFWVILWIILFAVISYQTSKLNRLTYWAAKRSVAAEYILINVKNLYPSTQHNTIFYIKNDPKYPFIAKEWGSSSKQAFYILSGDDALKLIYNDPTLKGYFEDMSGLPDNIDKSLVISYTAKFPY